MERTSASSAKYLTRFSIALRSVVANVVVGLYVQDAASSGFDPLVTSIVMHAAAAAR